MTEHEIAARLAQQPRRKASPSPATTSPGARRATAATSATETVSPRTAAGPQQAQRLRRQITQPAGDDLTERARQLRENDPCRPTVQAEQALLGQRTQDLHHPRDPPPEPETSSTGITSLRRARPQCGGRIRGADTGRPVRRNDRGAPHAGAVAITAFPPAKGVVLKHKVADDWAGPSAPNPGHRWQGTAGREAVNRVPAPS